VGSALASCLAQVRAEHPEVRWLPLEQLHVTLAFIGTMPTARLPALQRALAGVAATAAPFDVLLGGAGRFGGRGRQEVAWIGLVEGHAACVELTDAVTAAGRAVGVLDPPPTGRPDARPRPHLTVARRATPELSAAMEAALGLPRLGWRVEELVLFRSHLGSPRVRYEALASWRLGRDLPRCPAGG
jgi:RNA 2',3'-cyclic 3'-phosphodiesterase